jgi:hypothetical protein
MNVPKRILTPLFDGLPVRELDARIILNVIAEDVESAIRNDPQNCALSRCAQRVWGSTAVVFHRWIGYIDVFDEEGDHYVARCSIPPNTKAKVEQWDAGGEFPIGVYRLEPPNHAQTLERQTERRAARKAAKIAKGETVRSKPHSRRKPLVMGAMKVERSGAGHVHLKRAA